MHTLTQKKSDIKLVPFNKIKSFRSNYKNNTSEDEKE